MIAFIYQSAVVWKIPLAAALSWQIAEWAGSKHPYLAPLTVILSIHATVNESLQFAWQRVLGTIAGVLFTAWIAPYVGLNAWSIALLLFAAGLVAKLLKLDHAILIQVALSILFVMYFQNKMPTYSFDRIRDTVIGAVVAVVIQMILLPPDSVATAKDKIMHFADRLIQLFNLAASWVENGCSPDGDRGMQAELQTLFQKLHQATIETEKADQSLIHHPFARKKRNTLNQLKKQLDKLRLGYANLTDMIRVFTKWSASGSFTIEDQRNWSGHLNMIAELVKEWRSPAASDLGARVSALGIKAPSHLANNQFRLALYTNAEQIVQDFHNEVLNSEL
ncbi:FUSC family protein [Cohnella terricola]|uniref:FUSC family protein n=2 Tax=Cohnella terricola TaxID=1289167 RepID=A0A559JR69_9BACL|nr:FUSC family protein [Cohnella terricola]